jgi:hypothetical protein
LEKKMSAAASSSTYSAAIAQVGTIPNLCVVLQRALSDPAVLFYGAIIVAARQKLVTLTATANSGADSLSHVNALLDVTHLLATGTCATLSKLPEASSKYVDVTVRSKLRQLTVLSVCHAQFATRGDGVVHNDNEADASVRSDGGSHLQKDEVSYQSLATAIGVDLEAPNGLRSLEDTLLDALSNGLLAGKLNRKQQTLWVRHGEMESRDVVADPKASATLFKNILSQWLERCGAQLQSLEAHSAKIAQSAAQEDEREATLAARQVVALERAKAEIFSASLVREREMESVMDWHRRGNQGGGGRTMGGGFASGKRRW